MNTCKICTCDLAFPFPMLGLQVLKAFLTARQGYILQCLAAATGTGAETDLDSLACILADVATMVRPLACLDFQGRLFGGHKPWQALHQCMCVANGIACTMCWPDHYGRNVAHFTHPTTASWCLSAPLPDPKQVCATLAQCGELFLQLPGVSTSPLLGRALDSEDIASADLLFDAGREADVWKVRAAAVCGCCYEFVSHCQGWRGSAFMVGGCALGTDEASGPQIRRQRWAQCAAALGSCLLRAWRWSAASGWTNCQPLCAP